jgi:hypothetical protein
MEEKVEIKEVSEREILVGKNKLYFGEDNILYITVLGDVNDEISMKIKEVSDKFTAMVEGKLNLLVDLNKTGIPSADARKKGLEGFEGEKIGKIAFFGLHPVARVIASFIMGITKKEDIRFFKTREEALAWLKGEDS